MLVIHNVDIDNLGFRLCASAGSSPSSLHHRTPLLFYLILNHVTLPTAFGTTAILLAEFLYFGIDFGKIPSPLPLLRHHLLSDSCIPLSVIIIYLRNID